MKTNQHHRRPITALVLSCALLVGPLAAGALMVSSAPAGAQWGGNAELSPAQSKALKAAAQRLESESNAILRKYGVRRGTCSSEDVATLRAMDGEITRAYAATRAQLVSVLNASQLKQFAASYQERREAEKAKILCGQAGNRRSNTN